jgi:hypothetical protein
MALACVPIRKHSDRLQRSCVVNLLALHQQQQTSTVPLAACMTLYAT